MKNTFSDKIQADIERLIHVLDHIKSQSIFVDPIMFQEIGSSLDIDASDAEYLEESLRKSQEVPKALQQSSQVIDTSLSELDKAMQMIMTLGADLKAEKQRLSRLLDEL